MFVFRALQRRPQNKLELRGPSQTWCYCRADLNIQKWSLTVIRIEVLSKKASWQIPTSNVFACKLISWLWTIITHCSFTAKSKEEMLRFGKARTNIFPKIELRQLILLKLVALWDICMMTSFGYNYQNALRQAIVKNPTCVTIAAKCILVVEVKWRHHANDGAQELTLSLNKNIVSCGATCF